MLFCFYLNKNDYFCKTFEKEIKERQIFIIIK